MPSDDDFETNPLFWDIQFAFPSAVPNPVQEENPGFYFPIIDLTYIATDLHDVQMKAVMGHEIAHRLFSIDSLAIRLARRLAGTTYSLIWRFLSILAEDNATLIGLGDAITIDKADQPELMENLTQQFLHEMHLLNRWIEWSQESVRIVYELVVLEVANRLLREQGGFVSKEDRELLALTTLNIAAGKQAHMLYHVYPTYWLEKQLKEKGVSEEEKNSALLNLRQELQEEEDTCYYLDHGELKKTYEDLFKDLYREYEISLDATSLYQRIANTNRGIVSPLALVYTRKRKRRMSRSDPSQQWAEGLAGPRSDLDVKSLDDAWRISQSLELLSTLGIPEFYLTPSRMMTLLDHLIFEDFTVEMEMGTTVASEEKIVMQHSTDHSVAFSSSFSPSLLTLLRNRKTGFTSAILNEDLIERGTKLLEPMRKYSHSMVDQWWKWLLLFETVRKGVINGKPIICPLKGYPIACSAACPIKINLAFLQKHSQMVAEPFCDK